ncbi:unnamed protein product [Heligmosomoides polygyrus]|uniref:Secreted protein n=1 Tax=Heligmosomoides polygyrus TaxID=6339 RepID=A0A183FNQ2_HELPZ|nr:unnamed protein product [Heligmosomoides polygyrus]
MAGLWWSAAAEMVSAAAALPQFMPTGRSKSRKQREMMAAIHLRRRRLGRLAVTQCDEREKAASSTFQTKLTPSSVAEARGNRTTRRTTRSLAVQQSGLRD